MNKLPYALLVIVMAAVVNFGAWLLLRYTSVDDGMPVSVQIGGPIFTFVVGLWFFLTHPVERKK